MANYVNIATITLDETAIRFKKQNQSNVEFVIWYLNENINKVLPYSPDLIVLPECCDRPNGLSVKEINDYYVNERGNKVIDFLCGVAKKK